MAKPVSLKSDSVKKNVKTSAFAIYGTLLFLSLFFLASTHFFVLSDDFGHDAGIFAYIGYAITQGKRLYLDAWDNKGPLLYLINALGILIDYRYGICILEFITLFSSSVLLYKTAKMFLAREASLACAVACMMPLVGLLEGGNLSEEYALPFTLLAFYLIAKFLKNGFVLKRIEMIIVGCCISAVFLLRMNILAFLGCAVIGVIIILIKNKEFKKLGMVFFYAFAGFCIFLVPFVAFLASTGTLKACIDTAYLGVLDSFEGMTLFLRINVVNLMSLEMAGSGSLFLIICFVFFFILMAVAGKKNDGVFGQLCKISFAGIFATIAANGLSGCGHRHYFISFIPAIVIPMIALIKILFGFIEQNCKEKYHTDDFKAAAALVFVFILSAPGMFNMFYYQIKPKDPGYISYPRAVANYIDKNTEETDLIEVFGDSSAVSSYYASKRMAASNYLYFANGRFNDASKYMFADKIYEDVTRTHPKLIMFENGSGKQKDFLDHCSHSKEWNDFISANYTVEVNPLDYTVYKHK